MGEAWLSWNSIWAKVFHFPHSLLCTIQIAIKHFTLANCCAIKCVLLQKPWETDYSYSFFIDRELWQRQKDKQWLPKLVYNKDGVGIKSPWFKKNLSTVFPRSKHLQLQLQFVKMEYKNMFISNMFRKNYFFCTETSACKTLICSEDPDTDYFHLWPNIF